MRVMRAWHICPKWEIAFGAAAKCGSTMLARLIYEAGAHRLNVPDARHGRECWSVIPKDYDRVFIVRHPVERFHSLYANIQERKRSDQNFYKKLEGKSPADVAHALREVGLEYDFHFQPQIVARGPHETNLVRLESFGDWWAQWARSPARPAQLNESSKTYAIDPETAGLIKTLYRDDLALWERAWDSSTSSAANAPE